MDKPIVCPVKFGSRIVERLANTRGLWYDNGYDSPFDIERYAARVGYSVSVVFVLWSVGLLIAIMIGQLTNSFVVVFSAASALVAVLTIIPNLYARKIVVENRTLLNNDSGHPNDPYVDGKLSDIYDELKVIVDNHGNFTTANCAQFWQDVINARTPEQELLITDPIGETYREIMAMKGATQAETFREIADHEDRPESIQSTEDDG